MMVRIKELQRRLDQTLGKPGQYLLADKSGQPMTVSARLTRVESQVRINSNDLKIIDVYCIDIYSRT